MTDLHDARATSSGLSGRIIEPKDFVADTEAFVDVRLERSKGKASYSFIGPGVSQNASQVINIVEPHGFNIGAATLPHGIINNPHLHYTAEVFICTQGSFRFSIGEHGGQDIDVGPGTIFSVPTWTFRSFENTGPDDGWIFTVLGGDETGGIIWAPAILREASKTGLYLDRDYSILDEAAGDDVSEAIEPLDAAQLAGHVAELSDAELASRCITSTDLAWSAPSLLSGVLDGHGTRMAPVIGHGMSQDRNHRAPITNPHGFSLEWLEIGPGSTTGAHRHDDTHALFLIEGDWDVAVELDGNWERSRPATGSIVSVPASSWRSFSNVGDATARAVVVCGSDSPTRVEWSKDIVQAAQVAGWAVDASGYLAPATLIGGSM